MALHSTVEVVILIKGLDDDQIDIILRKYMESAVETLNYRAQFASPGYPVERFSVPLMAYAQSMSSQGGLCAGRVLDPAAVIPAPDPAASSNQC